PFEGAGGLVVGLDESEHLLGEVLFAWEGAAFEQASGEDREEDLDLVEPARVLWGEDEAPAWMLGQPVAHFLSRPRREVVADRDHFPAGGDLALELIEEAEQVEAVARLRGHRGHLSCGPPPRSGPVLGGGPAVLVLA